MPMAKTGTTTTAGDGCVNAPAPGSMTGKAVLIRRGSPPPPAPTCGFYDKAINAQNAGAAAVVLYNNVAAPVNPTVAAPPGSPPVTHPGGGDHRRGRRDPRSTRIAAGPTTLTWGTDQ